MNVSFEYATKSASKSNGHLYHIIRANGFTFCLICLEDISNSIDDVGKHLGSENHQENIKRLFQACNPNLRIDNDERFLDLVSRSVLDISVLLGKETCYICERDGSWFCVMCEKNITKIINSDKIVKDEIIDHVLSEDHVSRTKDVCFMYRLNSDKDFLLLHKSVVYCSPCKEVIQCKEADLLTNALIHLEAKNHQKFEKRSIFQGESHSIVKTDKVNRSAQISNDGGISDDYNDSKNESMNKIVDQMKVETSEEPHCSNESMFEISRETSKHDLNLNMQDFGKSFNENEFCKEYTCTCLLCKRKIKFIHSSVIISIDNHFKVNHLRIYYSWKTTLKRLMDSVIFNNDPDQMKLISNAVMINKGVNKLCRKDPAVKEHKKYIFFRNKRCCFCIVCMVNMPPSNKAEKIFHNLLTHFNSLEHQQCENEKFSINRAFNIAENDGSIGTLLADKKEAQLGSRNVSKKNLCDEIKVEVIEEPCFNNVILKEMPEVDLKANFQEFQKPFDEYEFCKNHICTCLLCKKEIKGIKNCLVAVVDHHFRLNHLQIYVNPRTTLRSLLDNVVFNKPPVDHIIPKSVLVTKEMSKLYRRDCTIQKESKYLFFRNDTSCFCIVCMVDMPLSEYPEELFNLLLSHFLSSDHLQCVEEQIQIRKSFTIDENKIAVKKCIKGRERVVKREEKRTAELKMIRKQKKQKPNPKRRKIKRCKKRRERAKREKKEREKKDSKAQNDYKTKETTGFGEEKGPL